MKTPTISKNLSDTKKIAENFLIALMPQETATVVALSGDLGAGKTAFVKELGDLLGIPRDQITSPTFVIMKVFNLQPTTNNKQLKKLIHIDAYRLEKEKELMHLGWKSIVSDPGNLIVIEWPEKVKGLVPIDARKIHFTFVDEKTREIEIE